MTRRRQVKKSGHDRSLEKLHKAMLPSEARIVGVITSPAELRVAERMRPTPDFFELRLDCLYPAIDVVEERVPKLKAPLIITARHPAEGGAHHLSPKQRHALLLRFLPHARYIDVELRSAESMQSILESAKRRKVGRIISFHDFKSTPHWRSLHAKARAAKSQGADIFKVATRTDTPAQLARLFEFVAKQPELPISAMGIGKLGAVSRIVLSRRGSKLNYASLGRQQIDGQLSIEQLRSVVEH